MSDTQATRLSLQEGDALILVDLQNDFLPGGALAVPEGDRVIEPLNRYVRRFAERNLTVVATRDWHPADHCSFAERGGPWAPHCIRHSDGAAFSAQLVLSEGTLVVSKAETAEKDAYSGFQGTALAELLRGRGVVRVFVGGLATDYCVLSTVRDALDQGFETFLLADGIGAVDVQPGDGDRAIAEMLEKGARSVQLDSLEG